MRGKSPTVTLKKKKRGFEVQGGSNTSFCPKRGRALVSWRENVWLITWGSRVGKSSINGLFSCELENWDRNEAGKGQDTVPAVLKEKQERIV